MKKNIIIFLFVSIFTGSVFSQFDAQLSQYMLHKSAFNPAAVGESGLIDVIGQYRMNMIGIPGAGTTSAFSINTPLKIGDTMHGLGVNFFVDQFGAFKNQSFKLQYAYKKDLGFGKLSLGADIGFVSLGFSRDSLDAHSLTISETYHNFSSDPEIPSANVVGTSFDMSLGAWFSSNNWYAGLSFAHLNQPVIKWGNSTEYTESSLLYLTGGFQYVLDNPKYILKPSVLYKTDFSTWSFDLTARCEYDNKFWVGLGYRLLDAVVIMPGVNLGGGLSIGYSVDIPTNRLITASYGSHEFVLVYSFEYLFTKSNTKYKSIRFM